MVKPKERFRIEELGIGTCPECIIQLLLLLQENQTSMFVINVMKKFINTKMVKYIGIL